MPVYEYDCEKCGKKTEALRPMRDADAKIACSHCGSTKVKRAQSLVAVGASTGGKESAMPMGGCGRCGDPNGSCGLN